MNKNSTTVIAGLVLVFPGIQLIKNSLYTSNVNRGDFLEPLAGRFALSNSKFLPKETSSSAF